MVVERLKHVSNISVSNVDKKTAEGEHTVRLCNYTDAYYNSRITDDLDFMEATATSQQIRQFGLRSGDILVTKDSETADDIGISALVVRDLPGVVCGYHLAVIRPRLVRIHPAYLYWALASTRTREQFAVAATGVTRFGLRQDSIGNVELPVPPLDQQRAIADYLDAETARIDALIAKKRRMIELLDEQASAYAIRLVLGDLGDDTGTASPSGLYRLVPRGWKETALRHLGCDVQTGPFGSQLHAEEYVEGGWPVVNPMNIAGGEIVAVESMTISDEKRSELARHILRPSDIVFGRRGEMGRAGLVMKEQEGWLCGTGSLRLRLDSTYLQPPYLKLLLGTPVARSYFELSSVGSTMDNLNSEIVLAFPALVPSVDDQVRVVDAVSDRHRITQTTSDRLRRQIELLVEHRQALIMAAVSGDRDVAGVAS